MMNRFTVLFATLLISATPRPALADAVPGATFDTVDDVAIEQTTSCTNGCFVHSLVVVTGMLHRQSTPSTVSFDFGNHADVATHCQRVAMVAMAKPGKYQFSIGSEQNVNGTNQGGGACRLTLVNP